MLAAHEPINGVDLSSVDAVRERAVFLRDRMSRDYLEMGRLLHHISSAGLYEKWSRPDGAKYRSFRSYIETELDFAFRKAKHLMSIWWWFSECLGGDEELLYKIQSVGWTKAAALVGVAGVDTIDGWLTQAQDLNQKELESLTRMALEAKGIRRPHRPAFVTGREHLDEAGFDPSGLPVPTPATDTMRVKLTSMVNAEERRAISAAMELAADMVPETDSHGELLAIIARDFMHRYGAQGIDDRVPDPDGPEVRRIVIDMDFIGFSVTPHGYRPEGYVKKSVQIDDRVLVDTNRCFRSTEPQWAKVVSIRPSFERSVVVEFDNGVTGSYSVEELLEIQRPNG